jgi:isopentenyl phosphate kinase
MIFLKLGGSLITDKSKPEAPRLVALRRLAGEIAEALQASPDLRVLIGHGSGSFGHQAAARHSTHKGAASPRAWRGFAEVWAAAGRLDRLVVDALREADLPVVAFPPSASAICESGQILEMAVEPIERAFEAGLLPVVAGDVAFDRAGVRPSFRPRGFHLPRSRLLPSRAPGRSRARSTPIFPPRRLSYPR